MSWIKDIFDIFKSRNEMKKTALEVRKLEDELLDRHEAAKQQKDAEDKPDIQIATLKEIQKYDPRQRALVKFEEMLLRHLRRRQYFPAVRLVSAAAVEPVGDGMDDSCVHRDDSCAYFSPFRRLFASRKSYLKTTLRAFFFNHNFNNLAK